MAKDPIRFLVTGAAGNLFSVLKQAIHALKLRGHLWLCMINWVCVVALCYYVLFFERRVCYAISKLMDFVLLFSCLVFNCFPHSQFDFCTGFLYKCLSSEQEALIFRCFFPVKWSIWCPWKSLLFFWAVHTCHGRLWDTYGVSWM